ncbi:MAG: GMC family oxidoreductase [Actinobacteria bacterium]|nr:GMC family oxidoreductase [Actinomycetota bacterium]
MPPSPTPPLTGAARDHVDVVVVGSGFGGSVAAYRLAEGGRSVVVLERGQPYPPGSFARTPYEMSRNFWEPKDGLYGLFDVRSFRKLEAIVSAGLGGGSLIYANVLLRKDERWFVHDEPLPGGGYENWPIGREDLERHYDAVEAMLTPRPNPYPTIAKSVALRDAATAIGYEAFAPPLAISFGADPDGAASPKQVLPTPSYGNLHGVTRLSCRLCGECDIGCNEGSKNTMDHTYLSAAKHHGADIRTLAEVVGIRPRYGGGYEVDYRQWASEADDVGHRDHTLRTVHCDELVLAAGTFGTAALLLRNRVSLPALGPALGTRFSGNGDLLTFLMGAQVDTASGRSRLIDGSYGPVITSAIRVPDAHDGNGHRGRGFYIQEAGFPEFTNWLIETSMLHRSVRRGASAALDLARYRLTRRNESTISAEVAKLVGQGRIGSSSLPLLGMGRDVPDGVLSLRDGELDVDWRTATSMEYFSAMRETMRRLSDALNATYRDNPLWWTKRVVTVHPLGGAPMGRHSTEGVVDAWGEAFGHPGLYVLDGAAMPGPVGPNPALTIAALADRAAERILERPRRERLRHAAPAPSETATAPLVTDDSPLLGVGPVTGGDKPGPSAGDGAEGRDVGRAVEFTEQMKGWVTLGETDPLVGRKRARALGHRLMFELTITAPHIEDFVTDGDHEGHAEGVVRSDLLGGELPVERGWFNLFVAPQDGSRDQQRQMRYRLWIRDAGGAPITLYGFKTVRDDPGLDIWSDTSTLHVTLLRGHVPPSGTAPVIGAGVLRILPQDFARQLTTFRAHGEDPVRSLGRFGSFFGEALWNIYGPAARRPREESRHD